MANHNLGRSTAKGKRKILTLLIFSPHPDDLELSCGLLCHRAMTLGWRIVEIVLTDGGAGGNDPRVYHTEKLRQKRMIEARYGASRLGVKEIEFWGYADSKLSNDLQPAIKRSLRRLRSCSPAIVAFPNSNDNHADHISTHRIVMSVLKICSKKIISLQYCFWGKDHTQNIVLVNPVGIITKEAAIKDHESQPIDRYLHKLREDGSLADGKERYYSRNPDKTILAMSGWGFDVHRLQRQIRV